MVPVVLVRCSVADDSEMVKKISNFTRDNSVKLQPAEQIRLGSWASRNSPDFAATSCASVSPY